MLAKSKPVKLVSKRLNVNQSPMLDSGMSYTSGNYGMPTWNSDLTSTDKSGRDRNENSASSSQVWHQNGNPRSSTEKSRRDVNQRSSTEKSGRKVQNRLTETRLTHHILKIFNRPYLEKVFSNVQKKMNRPEDDQILDLKVSVLFWRLFVSATMKAAIHLGLDLNANLFTYNFTQKLVLEQKREIKQVSTIEQHFAPWVCLLCRMTE